MLIFEFISKTKVGNNEVKCNESHNLTSDDWNNFISIFTEHLQEKEFICDHLKKIYKKDSDDK